MKEKQKKIKEKVVLFPGVVEKLVAKGTEALKEKGVMNALSYFEQALQIEPDHPQARFGIALSYIEQSRLAEAKDVTEQMLKEDIGNYYDILKVHISILVQLGDYNEVVTMLEGILAEERIPAKIAESFYHLLHFSRQMLDGEGIIETNDELQKPPDDVIEMLYSGSEEKQWLAIQMLGKMPTAIFFQSITKFLVTDEYDPVLKSIILQQLKEKNVVEDIEVHKFGKKMKISISNLDDVFHEKFGKQTLSILANEIENDNPSLYEMITHLWWHFLFTIYPIQPQPPDPLLWAASIHKVGNEMMGIETDEQQLAKLYKVNENELVECASHVLEIEKNTYKGL